ncbi:gas vesicle protein GvpN [Virgibacillus halodenitrificans]|uniref:gas vesicle protein GvpN n=1 Tax=Virgibacillus halodenitrificans TaxID=1482 RepID=UPI0024C09CEB|nr:gas vesicle protein GvpN [Virgibacillus halodenitrificans]WHX27844.1 gas vesicle protein GvpN [Virgibacillus halodenitrificans]
MSFIKESKNKRSNQLVESDNTKMLLKRTFDYLQAGYPIHFTGPAGTGKTSIALALARKRKRPVMLIHGNHEMNNKDLIGDFTGYTSKKVIDQYVRTVYKKEESVSETWENGRLLEAVLNGYTLVYDEFTRSQPTTNNLFLSILEEGIIPLYGTKSKEPFARVHPSFSVIFTSNPAEYAGVYKTQDALLDRLITIPISYEDPEEEARIVAEKSELDKEDALFISQLVAKLRGKCSHNDSKGPSLRSSLMLAKLASKQDIPIESKDEDFQQLCLDILTYPLSQCVNADEALKEAENIIMEELNE